MSNYQKLGEIDRELFDELNIEIDAVLEAFKLKITGLKNFYWEEIFDNLSEITKRLTAGTRDRLRKKLMANASIDFNTSNIRSVVIWILKNANQYYDEQMLALYDTFTTEEGIRLYKSNQHFVKDTFRYNRRDKKLDKYALDYRIILHAYVDDWGIKEGRVSDKQYDNIRDVSVIGRNLGFNVDDSKFAYGSSYDGKLSYGAKDNIFFSGTSTTDILPKGTKTLQGKIQEVYMHTNKPNENGERVMEKDGILYVYSDENSSDWVQYKIDDMYLSKENVLLEKNIFTTVKPYKNGNCHFQFNKEFIQKLNLEVGRIRGWLKDPKHAAEEMDISFEDASEYWNSNFTLLPQNIHNLLPNMNLDISSEEEPVEVSKNFINIGDEKVEISFVPDADTLHCGDMVEYKGEWIEVTFSNDHFLIINGEATKHFTKVFPDIASELTGHKSQFKRIEAIKAAYDELASPNMEFYAQRNKIAENPILSEYELHADVLNYAYWFYDLACESSSSNVSTITVEPIVHVEDYTDAHANGTLF